MSYDMNPLLAVLLAKIKSGGGGTKNYSDLENKPQINGVTLTGNKTSADLGISAETAQVDHGTADTTFILPPNQIHTWGEVASLTLTLGAEQQESQMYMCLALKAETLQPC